MFNELYPRTYWNNKRIMRLTALFSVIKA